MPDPRYRCPKTGQWVSEFNCMHCQDPPGDDYDYCWAYNVVDPKAIHIKFARIEFRWDSQGRDKRV
jgi:hypothetical protein